MSTEIEDFLAKYRADIEEHLREQIARHRAVDPGASTQRIKELQLKQEIERIEKLSDNPTIRDALGQLAREVLGKL